MMIAKPAPGSWEAVLIVDSNGYPKTWRVCCMGPSGKRGVADCFGDESIARFIAEAPYMFNLLTAASRLEELTGENLAVYARTYSALARAAIAKATGNQ